MNKNVLLLLLICAFYGCQEVDNTKIEEKKYELRSQICSDSQCAKVTIVVPHVSGDKTSLSNINQQVLQQVSSFISFAEKGESFESYDKLMQNFIDSYEEIKTKFPNEPLPWEAEITAQAHRLSKQLLSVHYDFYTFTGGAHGNHGRVAQFFDTETGQTLETKQLFVNYIGFEQLVKDKFYATYNIEPQDSLEEKGFLFENNRFYLPQNILMTNQKVIAYYNPYEIAPYASGATELSFSFEDIKPFLNPLYFKK